MDHINNGTGTVCNYTFIFFKRISLSKAIVKHKMTKCIVEVLCDKFNPTTMLIYVQNFAKGEKHTTKHSNCCHTTTDNNAILK